MADQPLEDVLSDLSDEKFPNDPMYPDVYGGKVDCNETRKTCLVVLPFPTAPKGRIVVWTQVGQSTDLEIAYDVAIRDTLVEAVRLSPPDDRELWQSRLDEAHKIVREGQIMRPYIEGKMEDSDAIDRLRSSGFTFAEAAAKVEAIKNGKE